MKSIHEKFLVSFFDKTVFWQDRTLRPNMSSRTIYTKSMEFKEYMISKEEFECLLNIIKEARLIVMPKESLMGYIEGYTLWDPNMLTEESTLVGAFGVEQLPIGTTSKDLSLPFCSEQGTS